MSITRKIKVALTPTQTWMPCKPPVWVKEAAEKIFYRNGIRPYDKVKIYYGNTFVYKVWFECITQGQIKIRYFKRKKIQKRKRKNR